MRVLACLFLLAAIAAACTSGDVSDPAAGPTVEISAEAAAGSANPQTVEARRLRRGFAFSPRSYTGTDLPDFLARVEPHADVLMHAGDWAELAQTSSSFDVFTQLAQQQGEAAVMVISPSDGGELIRPLDASTSADYLTWLRRFLSDHQPEYLGLANEVNMLAIDDPEGFDAVTELWAEALPIVRELAPETQVFVTFQYERTIGRHDGWFGSTKVTADWTVLDRFPGMDIAAFTTYPSLVVDDPTEIGAGYYAPLAEHTDLPIVFTEIGWTADETLAILPGSELEQVDFLTELERQACELEIDLLIWTFVYGDLVEPVPFADADLHRADGTPRPAWDRWTALRC